MATPCNSMREMSNNDDEFLCLTHNPRCVSRTGDRRANFKEMQVPTEYDTTQLISESKSNPPGNPGNPGNPGDPGNPGRRRQVTNSGSNPGNKKPWIWQRAYRWCARCCRKKRTKLSQVHQKKKKCCARLRDKCRRHHRRKKRKRRKPEFRKEDDVIQYGGRKPEVGEPSRERDVWDEKIEDPERIKRRRRREKELADSRVPIIRIEDSREDAAAAVAAVAAAAGVPDIGIDFTKSCCYLCAKNTMALAAAMSRVEKFHMSIQAATKETLKADKSCSPETHVRTVQSSVRVKVRDVGTHPVRRLTKRGKFRIKKIYTIIPKIRQLTFPKVRHVGCETDRQRHVPRCTGRAGRCVREHTRTR